MQIYFLRHGIAADRAPDGLDSPDRPLTAEGAARMESEALGIRRLGVAPELLMTSPLLRARQTAEIVGRALGRTPEETELLAPGGSWAALLQELERRGVRAAMLVGHEPDLSLMVGALTGGGALQLKKGGLAMVEIPHDIDLDGVLHWLIPPKALRALGERQ